MLIYSLAALVCIVGLLMYALSANGKVQEIGRIMFFAGLLAFLLGAPHIASALPTTIR
jgi:Na+/phosphate symporter